MARNSIHSGHHFGIHASPHRGNWFDNIQIGTWGDDLMSGGDGNDWMFGWHGDDEQHGGAGNDWLHGGSGDDSQYGGDGNDVLNGGRGDDEQHGGAGDDRLYGGSGDDSQYGGDGNDVLKGGRGDDEQHGGAGDDRLYGGSGDDSQYGGDGNDVLKGGRGDDEQHGDAGDDRLYGGSGDDSQYGGDGNDVLKGGRGDDEQHGDAGDDRLYGGSGDDSQYGGDGNDVLKGGRGDDEQHGDAGDDTIYGGSGDDSQYGGDGNDVLKGGRDDDEQHGDAGDDTIYGGSGDDILHGGDGNDHLTGGRGADLIFGGEGDDTAYYSGNFDDYEFDGDTMTLTDLRGYCSDGMDVIDGVEFFQFADTLATLDDLLGGTTIMDIQGAGHRSAFETQEVVTRGIVTYVTDDGYYMQDANGDGDVATSDAIFVAAAGLIPMTLPSIGDAVEVTGIVNEVGGGNDLTVTQIAVTEHSVLSTGNALPAATVLGIDRSAPTGAIDDDGLTSFDPDTDAIDFYESLEGMLVEVDNPLVVAATNRDGEVGLAPGRGDESGQPGIPNAVVTETDGIVDYNTEILVTDDAFAVAPNAATGDTFASNPAGIMDYTDGNYRLQLTSTPDVVSGGRLPETTTLERTDNGMTVATIDVTGLDSTDGDYDFDADNMMNYLADLIYNNLSLPDVIVLHGVEDGTDFLTSASFTLSALTGHIALKNPEAPFYTAKVDPADAADGGVPQVAFLFNNARVTSANNLHRIEDSAFEAGGDGSPGQESYVASSKPLTGDFTFIPTQETFTLVGVDLSDRTGDDSLYGATQPPVEHSLAQRVDQAAAVNAFVESLGPDAKVVVTGNMNDLPFSDTLDTLKDGGDGTAELVNIIDNLMPDEQFTFSDNGVAEALDHFLVSDAFALVTELDIVHTNFDFGVPVDYMPDHDPLVARIDMSDLDPFS